MNEVLGKKPKLKICFFYFFFKKLDLWRFFGGIFRIFEKRNLSFFDEQMKKCHPRFLICLREGKKKMNDVFAGIFKIVHWATVVGVSERGEKFIRGCWMKNDLLFFKPNHCVQPPSIEILFVHVLGSTGAFVGTKNDPLVPNTCCEFM